MKLCYFTATRRYIFLVHRLIYVISPNLPIILQSFPHSPLFLHIFFVELRWPSTRAVIVFRCREINGEIDSLERQLIALKARYNFAIRLRDEQIGVEGKWKLKKNTKQIKSKINNTIVYSSVDKLFSSYQDWYQVPGRWKMAKLAKSMFKIN